MKNAFAKLAVATLAVSALLPGAHAQEYPTKPIRLVVPFAPGGASDSLARIIADKMGRRIGQQFVVENRGGAGGLIGSEIVAKATPDGYTLVVSGIASHVVAIFMSPAPFDPMKDFTHIALFGGPPTGLMVNPSVPAHNVKEFIAYVKSKPQGLSYASPGVGTHANLIGELFKQRTGLNLVHVPYKGGGPAVADVVAGHVLSSFSTIQAASAFVRGGKARFLAITAEKRLADFPDTPTFAEIGMPELTAITWFGLSGPAGMKAPVVNRLNREVRAALVQPDVRQKLGRDGIEPNDLDAAAFTAFMQKEIDRWGPIAKSIASAK
jgi:tripartite-type tricarboxylate transporter receptor subunit TctC